MPDSQEWTSEEKQEAIQRVITRAMNDTDFRQKALTDGNEAVEEAAGRPLPEGYRLRFVDNAGADLTIVLADSHEGPELSDENLAQVAGGLDGSSKDPGYMTVKQQPERVSAESETELKRSV
jgi:hypothetical protein